VVAVSPIISGTAIKGPAADMLRSLGHEVSATGVARLYQGIVDGMVIDKVDASQAQNICDLGMEVLVTQTVMRTEQDRAALAGDVLGFCETLSARKARGTGSGE
jgi:LPPG:FO 2-phospho-L-lactate transferase